jgi:branched-chain amino acid transport system substrate-binding protein
MDLLRLWVLTAVAVFAATPVLAADGTVVIGMTASQTGPLSVDSRTQERGALMWRDEVNAAGGIKAGGKTYDVKFVSYDDQSASDRVQALYTRLIVQDKVQFLFGPYSSAMTAPAVATCEQYGKIMLNTGGSDTAPYAHGTKYQFQLPAPAERYLASAVLALSTKNPHAKIAIAYADDPFSRLVVGTVAQMADMTGLKVVMDQSSAASTTDFAPIVDKIIVSGADAFLGGGHYPDGAALARELYAERVYLKWVSILVAPADAKFGSLGPAALGITVPSQWEPQVSFKPQFGPTSAQFVEQYQARYHTVPDYHAASGYAGGMILQHAIEQGGSADPQKVLAALNALDVSIFFGHIRFSSDPIHHGTQIAHDMVLAQWQMLNGQLGRQVVWPIAAQSADLLYPIPRAR